MFGESYTIAYKNFISYCEEIVKDHLERDEEKDLNAILVSPIINGSIEKCFGIPLSFFSSFADREGVLKSIRNIATNKIFDNLLLELIEYANIEQSGISIMNKLGEAIKNRDNEEVTIETIIENLSDGNKKITREQAVFIFDSILWTDTFERHFSTDVGKIFSIISNYPEKDKLDIGIKLITWLLNINPHSNITFQQNWSEYRSMVIYVARKSIFIKKLLEKNNTESSKEWSRNYKVVSVPGNIHKIAYNDIKINMKDDLPRWSIDGNHLGFHISMLVSKIVHFILYRIDDIIDYLEKVNDIVLDIDDTITLSHLVNDKELVDKIFFPPGHKDFINRKVFIDKIFSDKLSIPAIYDNVKVNSSAGVIYKILEQCRIIRDNINNTKDVVVIKH